MPRYLDLTLTIRPGMPTYPDDPSPAIVRTSDIAEGAPLTASEFSMGCHVGTHVDAPAHFVAGGAKLSDLPIERLVGPARVVHLDAHASIDASAMRPHIPDTPRHLLIRTRNSELLSRAFDPSYCTLEPAAAEELAAAGVLSVGFDYYSLDPPDPSAFPAHVALAAAGVPVFVCLNLQHVPAGEYSFYGLPLKLDAVEAAPVRAVLVAD